MFNKAILGITHTLIMTLILTSVAYDRVPLETPLAILLGVQGTLILYCATGIVLGIHLFRKESRARKLVGDAYWNLFNSYLAGDKPDEVTHSLRRRG